MKDRSRGITKKLIKPPTLYICIGYPVKGTLGREENITGNVHIGYRRPDSTCGVSHTVLPLCFLSFTFPRERCLSGRYWPRRSLSLWVKCSHLWQCRREVNARIDKDIHLQWKIEYKSCCIGNHYKKVVYLGKEVYDTPACSLVKEFERAHEGESLTGDFKKFYVTISCHERVKETSFNSIFSYVIFTDFNSHHKPHKPFI